MLLRRTDKAGRKAKIGLARALQKIAAEESVTRATGKRNLNRNEYL
jgi:hypothetical protein